MSGLQKILKMYGQTTVVDSSGKKVVWVWDYANNKPRIKLEMTKEELMKSEKAKYDNLKTINT
jgi:hypothetical protein